MEAFKQFNGPSFECTVAADKHVLQEANQQGLRVIWDYLGVIWDWYSAHRLLVSREDGPVEMRIILKVNRNGEGCANVVSKGRWDLKNKRQFL